MMCDYVFNDLLYIYNHRFSSILHKFHGHQMMHEKKAAISATPIYANNIQTSRYKQIERVLD